MSTGEGRPNQPNGRPNGRPNGNKVPDLNEFMHKDNASAKGEQVDVQALISEIRRVPTNGNSASVSKPSSQASTSVNRTSSAASSSQPETQAMRRPGNTQGTSRAAAPKTASNPSAHPSNGNPQARRVSSAASRKRRQQIFGTDKGNSPKENNHSCQYNTNKSQIFFIIF